MVDGVDAPRTVNEEITVDVGRERGVSSIRLSIPRVDCALR